MNSLRSDFQGPFSSQQILIKKTENECISVCVCVRERERHTHTETERETEREREAESNSVEIILYPSSEDIHDAGNSPVSPTTRGQTIILVELE